MSDKFINPEENIFFIPENKEPFTAEEMIVVRDLLYSDDKYNSIIAEEIIKSKIGENSEIDYLEFEDFKAEKDWTIKTSIIVSRFDLYAQYLSNEELEMVNLFLTTYNVDDLNKAYEILISKKDKING